MTPQDGFGNAEFGAHGAHFVLEEFAQGFDELHVHLFGQAAHVVMALDDGARSLVGNGFDDVGVQRALSEELHVVPGGLDGLGFLVEDVDEGVADDLALLLRIVHAGQQAEEQIGSLIYLRFRLKCSRR